MKKHFALPTFWITVQEGRSKKGGGREEEGTRADDCDEYSNTGEQYWTQPYDDDRKLTEGVEEVDRMREKVDTDFLFFWRCCFIAIWSTTAFSAQFSS